MDQLLPDPARSLLAQLQEKLDPAAIVLDPSLLNAYAADATARGAVPLAVLRPKTTEEVSTILRRVNDLRQPIVVQGGRTGLSGASRPQAGEISLSLERMNGVEAIDRAAQTMIAGAGTPMQTIQQAAEEAISISAWILALAVLLQSAAISAPMLAASACCDMACTARRCWAWKPFSRTGPSYRP